MKLVPNAVSRKAALQLLQAKKGSPTILLGVGVVGMIGSTVLACRATLKMQEVVERTRVDLDTAKSLEHREYSEHDRSKDVAIIYTRGLGNIFRLYGPSVLLGAASIACLTKSHRMLSERNAALAAAYAAVDIAFGEYRGRVIEKYGEEQDREFRYSSESYTIVSTDDGKSLDVVRASPDAASMYARFFDEYSKSWSQEPEYNLLFIRCQQNYANDMLKSRGHVFLNEVYDMLGIDRSKAGQVVGWVISQDGDNYIDFGVFDGNQNARDFVNGREGSILLDFNVDGVIYDRIDEHKRGAIAWQS